MKLKNVLLSVGIVCSLLLLSGGVFYMLRYSKLATGGRAQVEVDWRLLGQMDYITGATPSELQKLDGTLIKIPGFMVPLEDNLKQVTQFLLVPSPQACIHVPPPPPNQMLLVNIKDGAKVEFGAIWVHGKLKIKTNRTQYGDVTFELEGIYLEPYTSEL